jgi:hypothetical protein
MFLLHHTNVTNHIRTYAVIVLLLINAIANDHVPTVSKLFLCNVTVDINVLVAKYY